MYDIRSLNNRKAMRIWAKSEFKSHVDNPAANALYHAKENVRNRVIHYEWIHNDTEASTGEIY